MKYLLLLLLTPCVFAQETSLQSKTIDTLKRTSEAYSKFYFGLEPIKTSENAVHIRFYGSKQFVDLYSDDGVNFEGFVLNKAIQYSYGDKKKTIRNSTYFFEYLLIDAENAKKISQWLLEKQFVLVERFPGPEWLYLHCDNTHFEFKYNKIYKEQFYHCPWRQKDSIGLAHIITNNHDSIHQLLKLDSLYNQFQSKLPKGFSYSSDGYGAIYLYTEKQTELWKKGQPIRDYLDSITPMVKSHVESELLKYNTDFACYDEYYLYFSENGKCKKISIPDYVKPTLKSSLGLSDYLEDKKELRKCLKKIKQVVKPIDLGFINSNYPFQLKMKVIDKRLQISGRTIY